MPINRHVQRIHILYTAGGSERKGAIIGSYVIHFTDGSSEELPIRLGWNIGPERGNNLEPPEARRVVWFDPGAKTAARNKVQVFAIT